MVDVNVDVVGHNTSLSRVEGGRRERDRTVRAPASAPAPAFAVLGVPRSLPPSSRSNHLHRRKRLDLMICWWKAWSQPDLTNFLSRKLAQSPFISLLFPLLRSICILTPPILLERELCERGTTRMKVRRTTDPEDMVQTRTDASSLSLPCP